MAGQEPLLPPLDSEPGPSAARSRRELTALRDRIVTRAAARPAWSFARGSSPLRLSAALGVLLVMAGTSYAAVRAWPSLVRLRGIAAVGSGSEPARPEAPRTKSGSASESVTESVTESASDSASVSKSVSVSVSASGAHRRPTATTRATLAAAAQAPRLDGLARANRLRAAQRWRAAEAGYVAVLESETHPGARAAAALAAADLRLHQLGRPRAALALFERALALEPAGALGEQARHGIAQAYRALRDEPREAGALRAFLHAYPQSRMRAASQARLRALER